MQGASHPKRKPAWDTRASVKSHALTAEGLVDAGGRSRRMRASERARYGAVRRATDGAHVCLAWRALPWPRRHAATRCRDVGVSVFLSERLAEREVQALQPPKHGSTADAQETRCGGFVAARLAKRLFDLRALRVREKGRIPGGAARWGGPIRSAPGASVCRSQRASPPARRAR